MNRIFVKGLCIILTLVKQNVKGMDEEKDPLILLGPKYFLF